eukprot:g7431.t1
MVFKTTKLLNSISSTPTSVSSQQTQQEPETPSKIREGRAVDLFQNITYDSGMNSPTVEESEGKQDTKSSSPSNNNDALTLSIPTVTLEEPEGNEEKQKELSPMSRFRQSANAASPIARKIMTKLSTKGQRLFHSEEL